MTPSHPAQAPSSDDDIAALARFISSRQRLLVLTGAGCSTGSGIPDYRDHDGEWKRGAPIQFKAFTGHAHARRRYWARSTIGWPRVSAARPNAAHRALAELESGGHVAQLVTQNVDRLHQRAGSDNVIDLHGRLDRVACLSCDWRGPRDAFQAELERRNPDWRFDRSVTAPDGDVDLQDADYDAFEVPDCPRCNAIVKPEVVFFGESIPIATTRRANDALAAADGLLVVGSSLMVFSGFRFARQMAHNERPVAAINLGRTRADDLINLKVTAEAGQALTRVMAQLDSSSRADT